MKKSKIPYIIIAVIVTFMLLDIAFVTLAQKTFTGVYTQNHFKKGLNFNKIYSSEVYSNTTGWQTSARLDGNTLSNAKAKIDLQDEERHQLEFVLLDSDDEPITHAKVKGKLLRPVTDKYDYIFDLEYKGHGVYAADIPVGLKGQWHLRIKAVHDDKEYIDSYKFVH